MLPGSQVQFTLTLSKEEIRNTEPQVLNKLRQNAKIPGFRPGKASDAVLKEHFGAGLIGYQTTEQAINNVFRAFIKKEGIKPISQPQLDAKPDSDPMELEFTVEVEPEITVKGWEKFAVKKADITVSADEVTAAMEEAVKEAGKGKAVDRAAQDGDTVVVAFRGKGEDGNVLPGTDSERSIFTVGAGQFLPDLEAAFAGMKAGEKKADVGVDFPKEYHAPDFAGKTVPFDIELLEVLEPDLEALTAEDLQALTGREEVTLENWRVETEERLKMRLGQEARQEQITELQDLIVKGMTGVELPASWVEREYEDRLQRMEDSGSHKADPEGFWTRLGGKEEWEKKTRAEIDRGIRVMLGMGHIFDQVPDTVTLPEEEQRMAEIKAQFSLAQRGQDPSDKEALGSLARRFAFDAQVEKYLQSIEQ